MAAYLVASVNISDMAWVPDYLNFVPPIVRSHGGRFLAVSNNPPNAIELVDGFGPIPDALVVIQFPSLEALKSFMADPSYQQYREARKTGSDSLFFAFENNDGAPQFVGQ